VRDPLGSAPCFSIDGSSAQRAEPVNGGSPFVRSDLSTVMVIMMIMRVQMEEPPYQD
jgi:hypothetical protein